MACEPYGNHSDTRCPPTSIAITQPRKDMILVDKPYVSDFLKETARKYNYPIVNTEAAQLLGLTDKEYLIEETAASSELNSCEPILYSTSENAIGWIASHLSATGLPAKIDLFKDKAQFRRLIQVMFPEFYFQEVQLTELADLDTKAIPLPCIIKPNVGFFSLGVHKVSKPEQWPEVLATLQTEAEGVLLADYPEEVVNTSTFIIEQCIDGDEFAVDAYYNREGKPVILNIHQHYFSSDSDVSDRVYVSSKKIIQDNLEEFTIFLDKVGKLAEVRNFPVHVEVRRNKQGLLCPIEINPLRFGGWCTTADATNHAYGFNPYVYYFEQLEPDWRKILRDKDNKVYGMVVLDNSTGVPTEKIAGFNYLKLFNLFEKPLELRKIDYLEYPVFGFLFTETDAHNMKELNQILTSDLSEFIIT